MTDLLTTLSPLALFGLASALLSTLAYLPYIIDTVRGRTRPQRASWLIWSVLGSIAFFSQLYEGAAASLWFAGVQVSGTITVFLLSIFVGAGVFLKRKDYIVLLLACVGLVLWYFTENAAYALAITITISLLGGVVTIEKAYRDPQSETIATWALSFVASLCAIVAVGKLDWVLLAYPVYLFALNGAILGAMLLGRARRVALAPVSVHATPDALPEMYPVVEPLPFVAAPKLRMRRRRSTFHFPAIRARAGARLRTPG
jgi:hypothetical protein